jgi:hypothetical protein
MLVKVQVLLFPLLVVSFSGCTGAGFSPATGLNNSEATGTLSVPDTITPVTTPDPTVSTGTTTVIPGQYPQGTTVCSPLNGGPVMPLNYVNGLAGRLYSLDTGAPTPNSLSQMFSDSTDVGINLFLDDLNVPTRLFTEGFPAADGTLLQNAQGKTLVEWFGMDVYSEIQLGPSDVEGPYQLAILADDGANLMIKAIGNNDYTKFIDDDGTHPTKMSCATSPLVINSYDRIPMHMQYYQGPRYEIALQLMWRPWPKDASAVKDPLCGTSGNYQFFDPTKTPSEPLQNYKDLLARGWKPLAPVNYVIPELGYNPCHVPDYWQLGRH